MKRLFFLLIVLLTSCAFTNLAHADALLLIPGPDSSRVLPLVGINVSIEIFNQAAVTTVRNTFRVDTEDSTNAVFRYRLPASASVIGFGVWRNDSLTYFDLKPGEEGGHDTSGIGGGEEDRFADFLGSNPFGIVLNHLPPGILMTELRFVQLLDYNFGEVRYDYPLFSGNFLPANVDTIHISGSYSSQREVLSVSGNYQGRLQIATENEYRGTFGLEFENANPEEDLQLTLSYNQEDIGAWILTHRTDAGRDGYFMLIIDPGIVDTSEAVTKYFTFVIDRSGSMSGTKIVQARQAVLRCLDNLYPRDYFNVIAFDDQILLFRDQMVSADEGNLQAARDYVGRIRDRGTTNIYGALTRAVSQEMAEGTSNQIIFATDGLPTAGPSTNPEVILRDVTAANRFNARIFSFGIGHDLDARFLTALSEANGGECTVFNPVEAPIDQIVDDFYTRQARAALIDPVVHFNEELQTDSLCPPRLQNVAAGNQLYLFGRYSSFGDFDVSLSGVMLGGDTTLNFNQLPFPEFDSTSAFVPRLWAKATIDYWLKWMLINGERQDIVDKVIELSLEFGILTPYTGFNDPDDPPPPPDSGGNAIWEPSIEQFRTSEVIGGREISWTVPGATEPLAFNIYRAPFANGPWSKLNDSPIRELRFLDTTVKPGETAFYTVEIISNDGSWRSEAFLTGLVPDEIALAEPFPNPFNATTRISFAIPEAGVIKLALYATDGREVQRLAFGNYGAGEYYLTLNAQSLAAGTYLLGLESGNSRVVRKVVILK